jgi:hypothetical protein
MEDFFKEFDLTEEDVKKIKLHYEVYLAEESDVPKLSLEDYFLSIFELGLLYNEIQQKEKEILTIKRRLGSISEEDYELLSM